jgi:NAD(P)-dependent dehydrogenase (short-subunit alcohol dehydrogenase family)
MDARVVVVTGGTFGIGDGIVTGMSPGRVGGFAQQGGRA